VKIPILLLAAAEAASRRGYKLQVINIAAFFKAGLGFLDRLLKALFLVFICYKQREQVI